MFPFLRTRDAQNTMKPEAADDVFMQGGILGKSFQTEDEMVNGEYGLVINGHSLVIRLLSYYNAVIISFDLLLN